MSSTRFFTPRRSLIVACLGATLMLVFALGYQAVAAAHAQRLAVEGVLGDYARLAADQYARNVRVAFEYEWFFPVLALAERGPWQDGVVDPEIEVPGQRSKHRLGDLAEGFFWMEFPAAAPAPLAGPPDGAAGLLQTSGKVELSIEMEALIRAAAAAPADERGYYELLLGGPDGGRRAVVVRIDDSSGGERAYGFQAPPETLLRFAQAAIGLYALLPESLVDSDDAEGLVQVRLLHGEVPVFESAAVTDRAFAARAGLGSTLPNLEVEASIPTSSAARLVIGGLPYSRLPFVAGMLVITIALLGIGVMMLRRDHELVELREQFVAGASHELRTPLAQIRMFTETLRLERVRSDEERRRSLEILDREARRLAILVENLLHFSSSTRGVLHPSRVPIDMSHLVSEVVEGFTPMAAARGARVVVHSAGAAMVRGDRDMLRQVLLNLLDNAVKYGPDGQTVSVNVSRRDDGIEMSVSDEGPGVSEAERARVWERFWRSDATSSVTGTGIGLYLVKELVELHGGEVAVDRDFGGGARFVVRLPQDEQ